MDIKYFADRLNRELTSAGFPKHITDRARAFSKTFKISSYQANSILLGQMLPSDTLLDALSNELEVPISSLCGLQKDKA